MNAVEKVVIERVHKLSRELLDSFIYLGRDLDLDHLSKAELKDIIKKRLLLDKERNNEIYNLTQALLNQ